MVLCAGALVKTINTIKHFIKITPGVKTTISYPQLTGTKKMYEGFLPLSRPPQYNIS